MPVRHPGSGASIRIGLARPHTRTFWQPRTDLGLQCAWCAAPVEGRPYRVGERICCSLSCAERLRCHDAWLPGLGDGDIDPTGSTPPRRTVS